jgi:hypothetical protein
MNQREALQWMQVMQEMGCLVAMVKCSMNAATK